MKHSLSRLSQVLLVLVALATTAFAQTGTATAPLTGVVTDKDGGVVPGATVVVKNNATGVALPAVTTNTTGVFSIPGLPAGVYTVTVTLQGFKSVVISDLRMVTATPSNIKITLELGTLSETVEVKGGSPLVQTTTTAIMDTINADQIKSLPLITKNALNFVTFLPGVDTGGTHSQRASTVAGLPQTALAITIDGVNTQDNYLKSTDGFFSIITPSVDAVEEVTVTTATQGADSSGQGAVQIKFTTKSGTNRYSGSLFETWRNPALNTNTFFNKVNGIGVNQIKLNQFGGNVGGPIVIPGAVDGRGKAFFFTNYEEFRQPSEITRTRTILNPSQMSGVFAYTAGGALQQVNVLDVARANGQISAVDPTVLAVLTNIQSAVQTLGSVTQNADPNSSNYNYNAAATQARHFPTVRLDFNLGTKHRLSGIYNYQKFNSNPDTLNSVESRFPGFPNHGSQYSNRNSFNSTLRSTLSPNLVNEAVYGLLWSPVSFFGDMTTGMFGMQNGNSLSFTGPNGGVFNGLTSPSGGNLNFPETRNGWNWSLSDKVSWQRGSHSIQLGGEFTRVKSWINDTQLVPTISFGVDQTNDPANGLFTTANFPNASTQNLTDARYLYALLTGRVTQIAGQLALDENTNQYGYNVPGMRRLHMDEYGMFVQDSWRLHPNFTVNAGLRYELQMPIQPENSLYSVNNLTDACGQSGASNSVRFGTPCNVFMPGTLAGTLPNYKQYTSGTDGYNTDFNNIAPTIGIAWLPNVRDGFLSKILGDPDQATVRAGYARAYNREGLGGMSTPFENNPGVFVQQQRNQTNGNLVLPGETWPVLLSQTARLGPAPFNANPQYPINVNRTAGVNLFDPDWQVGYADSYSVGLQRALSRDMVFEVRYVGTRGRNGRETENWNELNIVENGFLNEFKLAQANLYANIAAGRGQSFAYFGAGTGTNPLPTFLGYLNGSKDAGNAAVYTGANWTNTTLVGRFASLNPSPTGSAGDLNGDATRRAAAASAGIPINFFAMNPDVGTTCAAAGGAVCVQVSKAFTQYDALQLDLRRRLSHGLAFDVNYVYAVRQVSRQDTLRVDRYLVQSTAGVPHALKLTTSWDIPFGHGQRWGSDVNGWVDGVAGGWSVNLTGKVTSGQVLNFGNVRLVGMSLKDLQDSIQYRIDRSTTPLRVYNLPQDIIDNTVKAFSVNVNGYTAGTPTGRYLAPANGPDCIQINRGDCAPKDVFVVAPLFTRFDFSAKKRIATGGKTNLTLEIDVLNLFNAINFNPVISTSTNADNYRVTSSYSDVNGTFDPGSRVGQIVLRFGW
jgi:hypothetical protein